MKLQKKNADSSIPSFSFILLNRLYIALGLIGLCVAAYMSYSKIVGVPVVCSFSSCETVNNSPYAYIAGIPIAFYGLTFYALAINAALYKSVKWMFYVSILGVLFTGYFTFIEAFVIHAWCQWCLASAWISLCLFVVGFRLFILSKPKN
jgi:uncharacterized membrane protein